MAESDLPKTTSRIEAFTDGVFAIAITLLILDIHVPDVQAGSTLFQCMRDDIFVYLAFLIGFFTILICWINHHCMFEYINASNGVLLLLNGFKLLIVSFTPFATAVLSRYIGTDHQEEAVNIYTLNFFFMGLSMAGIWTYSVRAGLAKSKNAGDLPALTKIYIMAPVASGLIFLLSFVNIWICLAFAGCMFAITGAVGVDFSPSTVTYLQAKQRYSTSGKGALYDSILNVCYDTTDIPFEIKALTDAGIDSAIITEANDPECGSGITYPWSCLTAPAYTIGYFKIPVEPYYVPKKLSDDDKNDVSIYPNPTANSFRIKQNIASGNDPTVWIDVKIITLTGSVVFSTQSHFNSDINISNLPAGCYLIHITDQQANNYYKQIIKTE